MAHNKLSLLGRKELSRLRYGNLQKLFLQANQLQAIHSSAFYKLTGLIELDLGENLLSTLGDDNYFELLRGEQQEEKEEEEEEGEQVVASGQSVGFNSSWQNQSTSGREEAKRKSFLQHLSQLRVLNLSSNRLVSLERFAFSALVHLRQLFLSR